MDDAVSADVETETPDPTPSKKSSVSGKVLGAIGSVTWLVVRRHYMVGQSWLQCCPQAWRQWHNSCHPGEASATDKIASLEAALKYAPKHIGKCRSARCNRPVHGIKCRYELPHHGPVRSGNRIRQRRYRIAPDCS